MQKKIFAAVGLAGAALAVWLNKKRLGRIAGNCCVTVESTRALPATDIDAMDIDDDTAAEIISRARPALERAASFQ